MPTTAMPPTTATPPTTAMPATTAMPPAATPPAALLPSLARDDTAGQQYRDRDKREHKPFHVPIPPPRREIHRPTSIHLDKTNIPHSSFAPGQGNLSLGRVKTAL
jgi:hypothetical protein